MTFLKKLSIMVTLGLGMSFAAQAYDADALRYETTSILNFAEGLRQQNSRKARNVAQWLEKKAIDVFQVNDEDIILIARVVTNDTLKTEAKLALLSEHMNQEIRNNRYHKLRGAAETVVAATMLTGFGALMVWGFIESVKNPAPTVYVVQKPKPRGITVTWRNTYWPYIETTYV